MKRVMFAFCGGFLLGSAIHSVQISRPTPAELSLGQIVYDQMADFGDDVDFDQVFRAAKEFISHKRPLLNEKELYDPLMSMVEKSLELEIADALEKVEKTLKQIALEKNVAAVIPGKVYVELLEEGSGEKIHSQDLVSLQFKEYDLNGNLVKNTEDKSYLIPLSQTIKGFQLGLNGARVGEKRKLYIHPDYGFGQVGRGGINKLLIYEVVITDHLPYEAPPP